MTAAQTIQSIYAANPNGFPEWDLLCWVRLSYDLEFKVSRKIESGLFKATQAFCRMPVRGDCFCTPYGTHWYVYATTVLHHQITDSPEFVMGFNAWSQYSDDWAGRGGNPWTVAKWREPNPGKVQNSLKTHAWDAGYIVGLHYFFDRNDRKFSPIVKASETLEIYEPESYPG